MTLGQLILAVVGAYVLIKIGGWLLEWARRVLFGFVEGAVAVVKEYKSINAYALGRQDEDLEIVDEIEVDEDDLDVEVLEALERHGRIAQRVRL